MTSTVPPLSLPEPLELLKLGERTIFLRQSRPHTVSHPPLLLLHGWGGSSGYWRPTLAALGHDRHVIAPDLPGFGDSPPLVGPANAEALAEVVVAFADAMGLEQFDLNGHSFCASVAIYVAMRQPQRVRRLALSCISTFRSERERVIVEKIHHVMALWMALRRPWMARSRMFYRTVGRRFFYHLPKDDAILREAFSDFLKMDRRTALETAASSGDANLNPTMTRLLTPTVIIAGRQDKIMPVVGTPEVARLIPDSRLFWIEQCGHLPMIEHPERYHQILRDFLDA
ncbi:alpha/beta fold hydrolase [Candidatus Viridilinea mediisalina]|uniref:Alpha/beta hydrolase n=1 Tax=Candidatus Viridilinea mediisalina TaxID=2024553 RepID=A0A2A6RI73_9CHLR|nr:alpha/beta hydrolase [Candidatus Viridilinea mediisalina]PDW02777.1 alpha/beta hydrolase [Candidatus Viridilinea mediisalina]